MQPAFPLPLFCSQPCIPHTAKNDSETLFVHASQLRKLVCLNQGCAISFIWGFAGSPRCLSRSTPGLFWIHRLQAASAAGSVSYSTPLGVGVAVCTGCLMDCGAEETWMNGRSEWVNAPISPCSNLTAFTLLHSKLTELKLIHLWSFPLLFLWLLFLLWLLLLLLLFSIVIVVSVTKPTCLHPSSYSSLHLYQMIYLPNDLSIHYSICLSPSYPHHLLPISD